MGLRVEIPKNQCGLILKQIECLSWSLTCILVPQIMSSSFELLLKKI
jgi:hypothetical protein